MIILLNCSSDLLGLLHAFRLDFSFPSGCINSHVMMSELKSLVLCYVVTVDSQCSFAHATNMP